MTFRNPNFNPLSALFIGAAVVLLVGGLATGEVGAFAGVIFALGLAWLTAK